MKRHWIKLLAAMIALLPMAVYAAPNLEGGWQGSLDAGLVKFRVALVTQKDDSGTFQAAFNNIDDGIYDEPLLRVSVKGRKIHGELATGEVFDLRLNSSGDRLEGTYRQAGGSFQKPGKITSLSLKRGMDYLLPRLDENQRPVNRYAYRIPLQGKDGWETGDLRQSGVDLKTIEVGLQKILDGAFPHIHSLSLVHRGKLVLDEYFYGYGPGELHPVQSVTKSVFSLLFGIASDQGLLEMDERLYDFFPGYRQNPSWDKAKDGITLKMLLTMTSGLGCDDWKDSRNCSWDMVDSSDWLDFSLSLPLSRKPGKHFAYCGACLTPLSKVITSKSGLSLSAFAEKHLWEPLGIRQTSWVKGPGEIHPISFGLDLRPRDLAKIGCLVLNQGVWKGRRVISENWLKESTSPQVSKSRTNGKANYGFLWWQSHSRVKGKQFMMVYARGVGGQYLWVVPELELVCVATGGNYKNSKLGANALKLFEKNILSAF
jgi:CubicO group peptidase (beta-lactamase class C family)